jgi:hypothetical protein
MVADEQLSKQVVPEIRILIARPAANNTDIRISACKQAFAARISPGKDAKSAKNYEFSRGLLTQIGVLGNLRRFHETALRVRIVRGAFVTQKASQTSQPGKLKDWQNGICEPHRSHEMGRSHRCLRHPSP